MERKIEKEINGLVGEILDDYKKARSIDNINIFDQADKEVVIDILNKLRQIIFPGYFKNKAYRIYTAKNNLTMLLEDVFYHLNKQVMIVLRYDEKWVNATTEELSIQSYEICMQFFKTIPKIREYIETDVQAAYEGDPAAYNKDEIIFSYPGLYAIVVNRIAHELYNLSVPLIPRMMTEHAHSVTGIDIHPGATIGKYFFMDHGTGIVIGETTTIGDHVKVYQGVTLGALSTKGGQKLKSKKRHPTIKDNVTIYSGASILGGETVIEKDVVIGGNSFITKSIPAGTTVTVKNQESSYNYITNSFQQNELEQDESWFYVI